ncbi:hypothetical protein JRO89_XS10G0083100 [Xanthoceras sorbifolium]|uniref:Potassium transporter n=1 Tax=Xanthoceras sorbifolium TaxID=99658 RepID=A0ABQ8HI25_9ROSI|nr:hypothetical protein JRO89_XS10G0083100 [Xanthoceras sorbifolium]
MSSGEVKYQAEESLQEVAYKELKAKKLSRKMLSRYDSLIMESGVVSGHQGHGSKVLSWSVILQLAFQSMGVVYGDLGTSPLYVLSGTFQNGLNHADDMLGVVGLIPNQQAEDCNVSNFKLDLPGKGSRLRRASALKSKLENSQFAKLFLFFATLLGTSMVIGDGILTSCISVLSAVGGIKQATSVLTEGIWDCHTSILHHHPENAKDAFYKSVPDPLYWPMFVVAVLAAIISSQALISGAFSLIQQSLSLGCFPRVKVVHTSAKYEGQVYIPEVNYLLMLACVGVTLGFNTPDHMGNAYGIAVVFVMTLTSFLLVLVMVIIWRSNLFFIISYVLIIGSVEILYLSSVLYKFNQRGYLPLAFSAVLITVMFVWNNVYRRKYYYELENKVSPERLKEMAADSRVCRIPGLAMFYSELVHGIPPIFKHYVANVPAMHSVLVFVSMKTLPINKVPSEERFIFRRVEPKELNIFRCVIRYGYTDLHQTEEPLESVLVDKLKKFIRESYRSSQMITNGAEILEVGIDSLAADKIEEEKSEDSMEREIEMVEKAWQAGVVHLIGESEVVAAEGLGIWARVMINYAYNFLNRNLRKFDQVPDHIPHKSMLKVGMIYEL